MNYINYTQICEILRAEENNPIYDPKEYETVLEDIEKINSIIDDREKAGEIVDLAQAGLFGLLRTMYP